ncbi:MiaB/RimO family radical SAM methylthiotransferase [bacterium]|nr:MiaB/RimO family radical SAM methylthiotransferase [bacterium]
MRFEFITFGCKVNQYETQLLKENIPFLYRQNNDVCVINTCCVTDKVEKEIRRIIRKKIREGKKVWLTGCFVNKERERIKVNFPDVKIFDKFTCFNRTRIISFFEKHTRAFVKIEDGCENKCSYCIIPLVRGKVSSRDENEILEEIKTLGGNGYKEIVLTGVDLGAYGKDNGKKLSDLIEKISKIKGIERLRLSSIEVFHIDKEFIDFLSSFEIFCPHFHIPLQSGSDRILKLMRRRYNYSQYLEKIEYIRKKFKNVTFTTDIMIGFPEETDEDFKKSCKAVEEIGFLKVHIFPFSPREGTEAMLLENKVDWRIKKEREKVIFKVAENSRRKVMSNFLNKNLNVLVEKKEGNFWTGYSENYIPFLVSSQKDLKNEIISVKGEEIVDGKIYDIMNDSKEEKNGTV